jgi:3-oxoacyl-[acyl-carrier-protein] synthase III
MARRAFLELADVAKEVVDEVLAETGVSPADIAFFGVHQGTPWLRKLLLEHLGLVHAKSVETFAWAASLFGSNIPLALSIGQRERMLKTDDLVLMFAGGAGTTFSSQLVRWGR